MVTPRPRCRGASACRGRQHHRRPLLSLPHGTTRAAGCRPV